MPHGRATLTSPPRPPTLAAYQLVAEIGRGGMADVFLAVRRDAGPLDPRVVIKQLRDDVAEDQDFRTMFLDEARLAMKLVHPNIVRTFEVGTEDQRCFIAMEFLDGQPLSRIRRRGWQTGELPLDVQLRILCDALAGLDYVHKLADRTGVPLGIVHRDVTPSNIFVSYAGQVKVVDFGIAMAASRLAETTRIGVVKGKISYMAPEHARGDRVDRRSDIFSVGVMLWEAALGRRFWQGYDDLTIYRRLLAEDLPSTGLSREVKPAALAAILDRAIATDVERRFQTAAEMRAAIEDVLRKVNSRVDSGAVGRCVASQFARERASFGADVDSALRRWKAGQKAPALAVFRAVSRTSIPDSDGPAFPLKVEDAPPSSRPPPSRTATHVVRPPTASPFPNAITGWPVEVKTDAVDARSRSFALLPLASLAIGVAIGLALWVVFRPTPRSTVSTTISDARVEGGMTAPSPAPTVVPSQAVSVPRDLALPPRTVEQQVVRESVPPLTARVWHPPLAPPPVRSQLRPLLPPEDEFRRTARAKRTLDHDDPWSE